jgi:hypothetical protein
MTIATSSLPVQSFSNDEMSHPERAKNRIASAINSRSMSSSSNLLNPIYSPPHKDGINFSSG